MELGLKTPKQYLLDDLRQTASDQLDLAVAAGEANSPPWVTWLYLRLSGFIYSLVNRLENHPA